MDYPTDDDSDGEDKGFSMEVPDLNNLIAGFEKDDEVIAKYAEDSEQYKSEMKVKGFEIEPRWDIKCIKDEMINHLDNNITNQRSEQASRLMGMVEDVNEVIKEPRNKIYLR